MSSSRTTKNNTRDENKGRNENKERNNFVIIDRKLLNINHITTISSVFRKWNSYGFIVYNINSEIYSYWDENENKAIEMYESLLSYLNPVLLNNK